MSRAGVAHKLSSFAFPISGLHRGGKAASQNGVEAVASRKRAGIWLSSDSNSSFLRLYLDVVQLHLQKADLPYAVGLPWDTLCGAQGRAKLAFSLSSQERMWLDLCHSPHMAKHSHLALWRHLPLLRIANKPP